MKKLFSLAALAIFTTTASLHAACIGCSRLELLEDAVFHGGATNYIQNTDTLQAGSTFYVSSGTVLGTLTAGSFHGDGSALSGVIGGLFLPLPEGATNYVQNRSETSTEQPGGVVAFISSATASGTMTAGEYHGDGSKLSGIVAGTFLPLPEAATNYIQNRKDSQTEQSGSPVVFVTSASASGSITAGEFHGDGSKLTGLAGGADTMFLSEVQRVPAHKTFVSSTIAESTVTVTQSVNIWTRDNGVFNLSSWKRVSMNFRLYFNDADYPSYPSKDYYIYTSTSSLSFASKNTNSNYGNPPASEEYTYFHLLREWYNESGPEIEPRVQFTSLVECKRDVRLVDGANLSVGGNVITSSITAHGVVTSSAGFVGDGSGLYNLPASGGGFTSTFTITFKAFGDVFVASMPVDALDFWNSGPSTYSIVRMWAYISSNSAAGNTVFSIRISSEMGTTNFRYEAVNSSSITVVAGNQESGIVVPDTIQIIYAHQHVIFTCEAIPTGAAPGGRWSVTLEVFKHP